MAVTMALDGISGKQNWSGNQFIEIIPHVERISKNELKIERNY